MKLIGVYQHIFLKDHLFKRVINAAGLFTVHLKWAFCHVNILTCFC